MQSHHVASIADAAEFVSYFAPGDVVLVKASRAERFELLADEIQSRWLSRFETSK
jgi:UDP-N-acetylmuramoyl-tripeptide--D-alanyl-D-alanine ligase